jgi:hypothetical protein
MFRPRPVPLHGEGVAGPEETLEEVLLVLHGDAYAPVDHRGWSRRHRQWLCRSIRLFSGLYLMALPSRLLSTLWSICAILVHDALGARMVVVDLLSRFGQATQFLHEFNAHVYHVDSAGLHRDMPCSNLSRERKSLSMAVSSRTLLADAFHVPVDRSRGAAHV